MRKLIINQQQFAKLDEAMVVATDNAEVSNELSKGNPVQLQQSGKTGSTVNLTEPEYKNQATLSTSMKNATANAGVLNITPKNTALAESYSLTKGEIKVLSKLNENDCVYSKSSFKKMLSEEYADFNTRLNNRRKIK